MLESLPLVYELDDNLKPIRSYYLGDPEAAKRAAEAVASQTKTDMKNLKLGYTNRIQRPGIGYLNPYVDRRDPNYISYGMKVLDMLQNPIVRPLTIQISVDGPAAMHDAIRGPGSWQAF